MDKKVTHSTICYSFSSAFELVQALSSIEGAFVSVEESCLPCASGKGYIQYTIYYSFVDEGDE